MVEIVLDDEFCPSGQTTAQDLARMQSEKARNLSEKGKAAEALTPYVQAKASGEQSIDLMISGAHCAGCMAKIERETAALPDILLARMNLSTMRLNVQWRGEPAKAGAIVARLEDLGYGAKPFNMELEPLAQRDQATSLLKAMAVAGAATALIMTMSVGIWDGSEMSKVTRQTMHWISAAIAIPTVAYSGQPFFRSAWGALKNKMTNMDVPISLAVILAVSLSIYETIHGNPHAYFDAAVMLLFLLLIGRFLDMRLRQKTGESAQRLAAMQASTASLVKDDGSVMSVPASMIKPGDILLVAAGERIPVDGEIIKGSSDIDTSIATGETLPLASTIGDTLYSGMINLSAPLTIKASAVSSDSFLSEISRLVEAGEQKKSKFVRIADKAARLYVPIVHTLAALTFIGWMLYSGDLRTASLNAIAVLIITCPCALGLAVPAVQVVASGRLFKKGVLIKSGDALERLAKIDTIIFDKTGTLTLGSLQLSNAQNISKDALETAALLSRASRHPVARAVAAAAGSGPVADNIKEVPGQGVEAKIDGKLVKFGAASYVGAKDQADAQTESWLRIGRAKPIRFKFKDTPRMDAKDTITGLIKCGYNVELLTGDKKSMARETAELLGIDIWQAEVSPSDKLARLEELKSQGHKTLMIGDGINDAPALAAAYASASPAGAADVSRAAADIILQGNKMSGVITAVNTAKDAQKRVVENLSLAVIYNMIAVPIAVLGFVNPMIAALAMSGSSMLVTLNALRLKFH
ncbi:MAG: cadmium-translocating P-type ATPase [Robiginitomaculum sp.]|nr:cadmium-translocating P-type ATPase [Robiginitomaculum sp.]